MNNTAPGLDFLHNQNQENNPGHCEGRGANVYLGNWLLKRPLVHRSGQTLEEPGGIGRGVRKSD